MSEPVGRSSSTQEASQDRLASIGLGENLGQLASSRGELTDLSLHDFIGEGQIKVSNRTVQLCMHAGGESARATREKKGHSATLVRTSGACQQP